MARPFLTLALLFFTFSVRAAEIPPLQFAELGDFELVSGDVICDARIGYRMTAYAFWGYSCLTSAVNLRWPQSAVGYSPAVIPFPPMVAEGCVR